MNNRKLLSVSLTILLAVVMLALAAPAVSAQDAGQGNVNVSLAPSDGEVSDTGEVQTYDVIVEDADNGIGAYELDVSVGDTAVGEITDYDLTAESTNGDGPFDNSSISADGSTLTLEVALGNASHDAADTDGSAFAIATVNVTATGSTGDSTGLSTAEVAGNFTVAEPQVGQGDNPPAEDFYNVTDFGSADFSIAVDPSETIDIGLEPAELVSGPGGQNVYEVVVTGATEGIQGYDNVEIEIQDPSVAKFTDFFETANNNDGNQNIFSLSEIRDANGNSAEEGPVLYLEAGLADRTFDGAQETTIATVNVTATGSVNDQTSVEVLETASDGDAPVLQDNNGNAYPNGNLTGSDYSISFDMSLEFDDQEVQPGGVVNVDNVDSDGQTAAVVVTYENDAGDLVIAGLATGQYDGDTVGVAISDFGGFTENATTGDLEGDHTAHILPVSGLSNPDYQPGDVVSPGTASSIIDQDTATVVDPAIPALSGLDIVITEGLTIGDDYPLNQRSMFAQAGSVYGLSGLPLPADAAEEDQRFAPIASGQHVGLGGLPIQDEVYQWLNVTGDGYPPSVNDGTLLNYQNDAPTQTVAVSFDGDEQGPMVFDYGEAANHGLELASDLTASDIVDEFENINLDPAQDVTIDRVADEIVIDYDQSQSVSPTIQFSLVWEAADPIEGLSVDEANAIDYETDHRLIAPDADQVRDNFVTFEAGATGISHADTDNGNNGFIGEPADEVELESFIDTSGAASGTANDGSFLVWQNQRVTLETSAPTNTIDIYETAVDEDGNYTLGEQVDAGQVGFDDTAPGQVANLNTSNLTADQQYFVTFGDDKENAVVLDVEPLNLGASSADNIGANELDDPFVIDVTSDDTTGGDVEAWIVKEPNNDTEDVIHVERNELTGEGDREMEVIPSVDLAGPGTYTATVLHTESGVATTTTFTVEGEDADQPPLEFADDMEIEAPSLEAPEVPGRFDRGDVIQIEITLIGGNAGTITFGDAEEQNVEVTASVFDPTYTDQDVANNADTSVTLYLSTYHIGHGHVEDEDGSVDDLVANTPPWPTPNVPADRDHGYFTAPADDGSALVPDARLDREHNVFANGSMDIFGGSQGGAVLSEIPGYDLHATSDPLPYTLIGEDRDDLRDDVNFLSIEQRKTDGFQYWKAPGEGPNALDVSEAGNTTTEDIAQLVEDGIITPLETETDDGGNISFQGQISEGDFIIVQSQATGLEGVMLEAVLRDGDFDNDGSIADDLQEYLNTVLGTSTDEIITDEFTEAMSSNLPRLPAGEPNTDLLDYGFDLIENESSYNERLNQADPNEEFIEDERIDPDLAIDDVVANLNADGTLSDFYIPYELEQDLPVQTAESTLATSLTFDSSAVLEPRGGAQPNIPNNLNSLLTAGNADSGEESVNALDYNQALVEFDGVHTNGGQIQVPRVDSYTISGTSTMSPGTLVDIVLLSETDEATPFLKTASEIQLTEQDDSPLSAWEATFDFSETRDDVEIVGGTVFEADITRTGGSSVLGGDDIPGLVLNDPAVESFTVNDQRSDGDVVTIEAFESNRMAQITIEDASGAELGTSDVLARNTLHEQFNVVLDQPLSSNQEVTAVAEFVQPDPAQFNDTVLQEETAEILVEDESEAFLSVGDLSPSSATVAPGDVVEVSATVENLGDLEGTQTIELNIDGISQQESVTLAGGASDTVMFTVDTSDVEPGQYTHTVSSDDSSVSGGLTVEAPPEPAAFEIVQLSPSDATATVGDTVTVDVAVQNTGEQEGTQTVNLTVDGTSLSQEITLAGGDAGSVSFDVPTGELSAGDYTHTASVGDASVEGSLTLEEPMPEDDSTDDSTNNTTDDGDDSEDGGGPGFGIVVAALALLGAALLAMRRQVE